MSDSYDPWSATTGTRTPLADDGQPNPFAGLRAALRGDRHALPARDVRILRLRFGLDDCVPATRGQVSQVFGITRQYVGTLERAALRRLGLDDLHSPAPFRDLPYPGYEVWRDGSPVVDAVRNLHTGHKWWRVNHYLQADGEGWAPQVVSPRLWTDGEHVGPWDEISVDTEDVGLWDGTSIDGWKGDQAFVFDRGAVLPCRAAPTARRRARAASDADAGAGT